MSLGGKRRRSRKVRRGGAYGAGPAIAPGALTYGAAYTGAADPKTGAPVPEPALIGTPSEGSYTGIGGRRRRGSRKTAKKGKKGGKKTRKMRGGANSMSMGGVGYGYTGAGMAGLVNPTQYVKGGNPI
jgi:hypothetical protein